MRIFKEFKEELSKIHMSIIDVVETNEMLKEEVVKLNRDVSQLNSSLVKLHLFEGESFKQASESNKELIAKMEEFITILHTYLSVDTKIKVEKHATEVQREKERGLTEDDKRF